MERETQTVFTIATQNVLLDYGRTEKGLILPQDERIDMIATSLASFPEKFDVVGIQEAHKSKQQHNGPVLAERLGYGSGVWVNHNQKPHPKSPTGRANEYVGLFGTRVENAEKIELGDNRRALFTEISGVAFVTIHLRAGVRAHEKRVSQVVKLAEALESFEHAVILGDFNEPPIKRYGRARNELARVGFRSVFDLTSQLHPKTLHTDSYKDPIAVGLKRHEQLALRVGSSIDDIFVRGQRIQVLSAGVLHRVIGASDHDGLWAKLKISTPKDIAEPIEYF